MILLYCDGSIQGGNPGGWAVGGFVAKSQDGAEVLRGTVNLGTRPENTNNMAEYAAVWGGLAKLMTEHAGREVVVHSDSQLVVNQLNRTWNCANQRLSVYRQIVERLVRKFERVTFVWIPREENTEADAQSRTLYEDSGN
jgi:ribonuclease HI